ncbi:MAG TPA: class I SAM-dependent methyltransferase [Gaiellales bacterium]|nr:class I SAM-dependent methyltransferase [Gaiellales bacterium]
MEDRDRRARSFGAVADRYARARPGYPQAAVEWLLEGAPGRKVVDLAAGTGKLTQVLVESGAAPIAVEPDAGMRAALVTAVPGVEAMEGSAEAIPLPDACADAVLVAQAFHWFDPERACDEIARVLRPGGVLGLLWNLRDGSVPWVADLDRILDWPADVVARAGDLSFEEIERHPLFAVGGRREFPNPVGFTPSRLVDWAASTSRVATRPEPEREAVLAGVAELTRTHPDLCRQPVFAMPYTTVAIRFGRSR